MLAGDGAAHLDALLQHLARELLGAVQLVGVVGVEQDERMQVAVAGVEHVRAAQAVFALHGGDEGQHLAQALARNGAVHAVVVGRDAADRGKRRLAAGPETQALGFVARHRHARGAGALEHRLHARDLVVDFLGRAVGLAQQDGRRLQVVAGVHELLDRVRRRPVHHLEPGGNDAGGDHVRHRGAGFLHIVERGHDDARALRLGQQLERDLGHHHQHALGADRERQQVVARRVGRLAAARSARRRW